MPFSIVGVARVFTTGYGVCEGETGNNTYHYLLRTFVVSITFRDFTNTVPVGGIGATYIYSTALSRSSIVTLVITKSRV